MKDVIRIVILSRDRTKYLKETIDSVLNQSLSSEMIRVVVSDNSEKDEVGKMIEKNYSDSDFEYVRRNPTLSSLRHYQSVISECKEKYLVIFHDDDIMRPDYIKTMFPFIQKKGVAAVGCNAFLFESDLKSSILSKPFSFEGSKTFTNEKDFLKEYIPSSKGIAAFPGHIYNTDILKKIKLRNVHRKDAGHDVLTLNSLLSFGTIIWIPNFLMHYRLHNSNDGSNLYTGDHISLLNRMAHSGLDKHTVAAPLRFNYLFQWFLAQDIKDIFLWRNRIVFKYLFFKSFYLVRQADLWKSLLNNRYVKNKILRLT